MKRQTFQHPELRDANDNIIQEGAFGKNTALANSTNDGWIDYVANDLNFLYDLAKDEVVPVSALPASGDMNKTYLLTTNGKTYRWSGTAWVELTNSEAVGRAENAATLAEQWATKTDGTVADNEYSAKYYANAAQQSADDAQDTADDIADHLVQIDKNTGGVSKNSKRISNIEKLLQGNLCDYQTDTDSAYTKTVPAGAMPYAGIEQIGGKTLVWNQLVQYTAGTLTNNGIIFTRNDDGSINVSGTATENAFANIGATFQIPTNHKYLVCGCPAGGSKSTYYLRDGYVVQTRGADTGNGYILDKSSWGSTIDTCIPQIVVLGGTTVDLVFKPQFIDLTRMFGSGNEPTTVKQFREMFPAEYYPYNAGELLSAGVTEVVSKKADTSTIATYPVPAEIQALEGYGWSAGTAYNYVDFERKVFVKCVNRVDLSTLNWSVRTTSSSRRVLSSTLPSAYIGKGYTSLEWVCDVIYNGASSAAQLIHDVDTAALGVYSYSDSDNGQTSSVYVVVGDTSATTVNGTLIYGELATPVETDISQYLTDNLIEVGAGGTLTFPNANGDDYHIPVPSTETYMIDLQEAISNG